MSVLMSPPSPFLLSRSFHTTFDRHMDMRVVPKKSLCKEMHSLYMCSIHPNCLIFRLVSDARANFLPSSHVSQQHS